MEGVDNISALVEEQYNELHKEFPLLKIRGYIIEGQIEMNAIYNDIQLYDEYSIRIEIPKDYPESLPMAYEMSEKIPKDFVHFLNNGALCLGVTNDLWDKFTLNPTLLFFVKELVIGYLYSVTYFIKYGTFPFGERPHGTEGILDYYYDKLELSNAYAVFGILGTVCYEKYRGHQPCPCGSGKKGRNCHGDFILSAIRSNRKAYFYSDAIEIYKFLEGMKRHGGSTSERSF